MDRPQLIHRLRIAASMFFAVVAVALCLMSVRSHRQVDILYGAIPEVLGFEIGSRDGSLVLTTGPENRAFGVSSFSSDAWQNRIELLRQFHPQGSSANHGAEQLLSVPYGVAVVLAGFISASLWLNRFPRFSLRTLLIATTCVAVVLGLGAWAAG